MPNAADIVNELLPNIWIFCAHILATISLLIILSKLVYEPFKAAMRKRRQGIKDILIDANKKHQLAEEKAIENIKILEDTRSRVKSLIDDAVKDAELDKKRIIQNANDEATEMIHSAKASIASENKKNNQHAKEVIANNSILIASKIIETKLNEKDHKKIIDSFINDLDLNGEYDD